MGLGIRFYKLTMKSIAFLVLGVFTFTKGKLQQSYTTRAECINEAQI